MQCHTTRHGLLIRKRAYSTKKRAKSALAKVCNVKGWNKDEFKIYRCSACGEYHFGRVSKKRGRKSEQDQLQDAAAATDSPTIH